MEDSEETYSTEYSVGLFPTQRGKPAEVFHLLILQAWSLGRA